MTEEEWFAESDTRRLLRRVSGKVSPRKLRLFMVGWCRFNRERITVPVVFEAMDLAERFAEGRASKKQVETLFDQCRGTVFGMPNGYLLWPDSKQMEECVHRFCLNGENWEPGRSDDHGESHRAGQLARSLLFRDIVGNPFRPVAFDPAWRTSTAVALARQMYDSREFGAMPILADALQDAGCEDEAILNHCRDANQPHVRGCWVVDLVLGKEWPYSVPRR
jgi:hypothetical protein